MKVVSQLGTQIGSGSSLAMSLLAASLLLGCNKDEAPPPLPEAKPTVEQATLKLEVPTEDAGGPAKEAPKKTGSAKRPAGALAACCAALRQNAASAPPETQGHMLNAAAACDAANAAGTQAGFLASLSALLRGAGVPAACR